MIACIKESLITLKVLISKELWIVVIQDSNCLVSQILGLTGDFVSTVMPPYTAVLYQSKDSKDTMIRLSFQFTHDLNPPSYIEC